MLTLLLPSAGATLKLFAKRRCKGGVGEYGSCVLCCAPSTADDDADVVVVTAFSGVPNDIEPTTPAD